ncbi:MAG: hypothetical protein HY819_17700 [Acidobacteria bacterium]|nr:hypothetical protein [Acidobacteriota bacterium]
MDDMEKELASVATEKKSSNAQVITASLISHRSLQNWLDIIESEKKTHYLFELEMWLKALEAFFNIKNHPFSEQELKDIVRRNFLEELKVVRNVILRMIYLSNQLINENHSLEKSLSLYYESIFQKINWSEQNFEKLLLQPTPEDSLALFTEMLSDICTIIDSLVKTDSNRTTYINFQTFTSIGKLSLRENKLCYYINLLSNYKFKSTDRIENLHLVALINSIDNEIVRQEITKTLIEFFRLLKYLDFVSSDLSQDRPLKNCLPIFTLIKTEAYELIRFMDKTLLNISDLPSQVTNSIDGCVYALQMDLKKVFGRELLGLVALTQAPSIYAKVENSHGLLRDCFQQSVVTLVQIFEQGFDGLKIFNSFQTKLDQSVRLRLDIWRLLRAFRKFQKEPSQNKIMEVNDQITLFRDTSLKYLMYKDWDDFEKMTYQAMSTRVLEDFSKIVHVFATFLEALLGQINMRAALANHPFDYPEV